jgi:hypothetical protein
MQQGSSKDDEAMLVRLVTATPEDGGSWWRYETTVEGSTWLTPGHPFDGSTELAEVKLRAGDRPTTGLPGHAGSLEAEKEVA